MQKNNLKLDPDHPYYRICPYCQKPFMTENKSRDYCCDQHADSDYNRYRKLKKTKEESEQREPEKKAAIPVPETPEVVPLETPGPVASETPEEILKKTIDVLCKLTIDSEDGTVYPIQQLEKLGVDFNHYSYSYPLCNTKDSNCIMFGSYETFLISPTNVLIYFKNK